MWNAAIHKTIKIGIMSFFLFTDFQYESDQEDLVGHFEYYPDGSAQFSMKKGSTIDEITKRTGNTGHFEEYKNTTSHDLDKLKDLMTSGGYYKFSVVCD